jgi:eukaryotic-like serine/threonine-protein kinase
LAYASLSIKYGNLGQNLLALECATKAYELRDRVTQRERLHISAAYFDATGDLAKENQIYELWIAEYPRDSAPHRGLGSNYYNLGQLDKALTEHQEAMRLAPDEIASYSNLGWTYLLLNRLDEAKATFHEALARKLDDINLHNGLYNIAFLQGDAAQMKQQLDWGADKPGDEDLLLSNQSSTEFYYGRLSKARDFAPCGGLGRSL